MYNTFLFNEPLCNLDVLPSLNHYVIAGSYRFLNKPVNHVRVIGKDGNEDLVFGESEDSMEELAAGERLTFKLMTQLESEEEANAAAEAVQSEFRLNSVKGYITCPPNCGADLYDVIRIYDYSLSYPGNLDYRIAGIQNRFNSLTGSYIQLLYLSAV